MAHHEQAAARNSYRQQDRCSTIDTTSFLFVLTELRQDSSTSWPLQPGLNWQLERPGILDSGNQLLLECPHVNNGQAITIAITNSRIAVQVGSRQIEAHVIDARIGTGRTGLQTRVGTD